jgi:hypothetical protein
MLREFWTSSERKTKRALQGGADERRSWVDGGVILIRWPWLGGMLMLNGGSGSWSVGPIPCYWGWQW